MDQLCQPVLGDVCGLIFRLTLKDVCFPVFMGEEIEFQRGEEIC